MYSFFEPAAHSKNSQMYYHISCECGRIFDKYDNIVYPLRYFFENLQCDVFIKDQGLSSSKDDEDG